MERADVERLTELIMRLAVLRIVSDETLRASQELVTRARELLDGSRPSDERHRRPCR